MADGRWHGASGGDTVSFAHFDSEERRLLATAGAHTSWAKTEDWSARTQPARDAFNQRFYDEVDPDGVLPPEVREKRAESARKAYFLTLSRKAAQARKRRAGGSTG